MLFYLLLIDTEEERSKFTRLYEKYNRLMFHVAKQVLQDDFLAEDAMHEAFLTIIDHLKNIDGIDCPKTKNFIVIIVKNKARDLGRKRRSQDALPLDEEQAPASDPIREETDVGQLKEAIRHLPDGQREVLELKAFYGYSNAEIAGLLSITEDAVRKRLERARGRIAEEYGARGEKYV